MGADQPAPNSDGCPGCAARLTRNETGFQIAIPMVVRKSTRMTRPYRPASARLTANCGAIAPCSTDQCANAESAAVVGAWARSATAKIAALVASFNQTHSGAR